MDGAEPIGEVLTIWTLCDDAFMVPAKGGTGEGEMVAAIVCAFHHGSWGWRSWHWGRVVLVKWELRLVTALCPTLMFGAVPFGGALGEVVSLCLAPLFGTSLIFLVSEEASTT
jgi:hypothetical protein